MVIYFFIPIVKLNIVKLRSPHIPNTLRCSKKLLSSNRYISLCKKDYCSAFVNVYPQAKHPQRAAQQDDLATDLLPLCTCKYKRVCRSHNVGERKYEVTHFRFPTLEWHHASRIEGCSATWVFFFIIITLKSISMIKLHKVEFFLSMKIQSTYMDLEMSPESSSTLGQAAKWVKLPFFT